MAQPPSLDALLVARLRRRDDPGWDDAWAELIARYEGRLAAFARSRVGADAAEDIVQETFIGFHHSLPNYDGGRSLESYLFAICAFKLTDHLRRQGRRPTLPLAGATDSTSQWNPAGPARPASSLARSGERRQLEEEAVAAALAEQVARWRERGEWLKLKCLELLVVRGRANKEVARELQLSEQQVANFKFDFLARLRTAVQRQNLSPEVFPELRAAD